MDVGLLSIRNVYALWRRYNAEVFGGALKPLKIQFGNTYTEDFEGDWWGFFEFDAGPPRIVLMEYLTTPELSSTLLHEMVHQYQYENGQGVNHGPSFRRWSPIIRKLTGYTIA